MAVPSLAFNVIAAVVLFGLAAISTHRLRSYTFKHSKNKHWSACVKCPSKRSCPVAKKHNPSPEEYAFRASLAVQIGLGVMFLWLSISLLGGLYTSWAFSVFTILLIGGLACSIYSTLRPSDHDWHLFWGGCTPWIFLIAVQLVFFFALGRPLFT